jgi:DnaK suppressor protein
MARSHKNLVAKSAGKSKAVQTKSSSKAKPAAKKPAAKPAKPAAKTIVAPVAKVTTKPVAKTPVKPTAKAPTKAAVKPAAKPAGKPAPKAPPVLNAGAARAKALAEARAEAARIEAEKQRVPKLVRATPEALRERLAPKLTPGGKPVKVKPAPEVRPLGVLPQESIAKVKSSGGRVIIPMTPRVEAAPAAPAAKSEERLSKADLRYFEDRLLKERRRIMGEMGHLESTILKVNPRDSAGETAINVAEAGSDSLDREVSFDIASKEGRFLREITDALSRIYNGVYGICESSGKSIARARLEALPWARYTVQEQENIERMQRAGRMAIEEE